MKINLESLKKKILDFTKDRNWDQFHSPKNLAMSISIESAELMEIYQWLDPEESLKYTRENKNEIESEVADIFNYLILFCEKADIDLVEVTDKKLRDNEKKYPVKKSKNSSKKYNKL